jgi:hypothetical protein
MDRAQLLAEFAEGGTASGDALLDEPYPLRH